MEFLFPTHKSNKAGIYIHYPYCVHKCSYCDFYSIGVGKNYPDDSILFENYKEEILFRKKEVLEIEFDTIFVGGGTPSISNHNRLKELLKFLYSELNILPNAELSLEANPEDISESLLESWSQMGFNRINVGIQSFQSKHLQTLDRFYDTQKYENVLKLLSKKIISRYGVDLIYGIPNQTKEEFWDDLNKALDSGVNHISAYSLTVEKGTQYSRNLAAKIASPPNEDLQSELLIEIPKYLSTKGFVHYEVSNFCLPNQYSRHNWKYWTMEFYLGIGPGAHGFLPSGRYANPRSIESYCKKKYSANYEKGISIEEIALCVLRLFTPIHLDSFIELANGKIKSYKPLLQSWEEKGFSTYKDGIFCWKPSAIIELDSLILEFVNI
jgi:oxygen-independent coproporphyrinogen-3 oxidase